MLHTVEAEWVGRQDDGACTLDHFVILQALQTLLMPPVVDCVQALLILFVVSFLSVSTESLLTYFSDLINTILGPKIQ